MTLEPQRQKQLQQWHELCEHAELASEQCKDELALSLFKIKTDLSKGLFGPREIALTHDEYAGLLLENGKHQQALTEMRKAAYYARKSPETEPHEMAQRWSSIASLVFPIFDSAAASVEEGDRKDLLYAIRATKRTIRTHKHALLPDGESLVANELSLAAMLHIAGRKEESAQAFDAACESLKSWSEKVFHDEPPSVHSALIGRTLMCANTLLLQNRLFRESVKLSDLAEELVSTRYSGGRAAIHQLSLSRAASLQELGETDEALKVAEVYAKSLRGTETEPQQLVDSLSILARLYNICGRTMEAQAALGKIVTLEKNIHANAPQMRVPHMLTLATVLTELGIMGEAEEVLDEIKTILNAENSLDQVYFLREYARFSAVKGKLETAIACLNQGSRVAEALTLEKAGGPLRKNQVIVDMNLQAAKYLGISGNQEAALDRVEAVKAHALDLEANGVTVSLTHFKITKAMLLVEAGHFPTALELYTEASSLAKKDPAQREDEFMALFGMAQCHERQYETEEAARAFEKAYEACHKYRLTNSFNAVRLMKEFAACIEQSQPDRAEKLREEAEQIKERLNGLS